MALSAKLQMRQSQSLVMTPQLMQSIRMLQFSHLELSAYIAREMESNPLLELAESREEPIDLPDAPAEPAMPDIGTELETSAAAIEEKLDMPLENVFDVETSEMPGSTAVSDPWKSAGSTASLEGDNIDLDAWCAATPTLADHMHAQLSLTFRDHAERAIAANIVDSLDEDGYLRRETAEIATSLGANEATVEAVIAKLQTFDPSGVCARNLGECLSIQLAEQDRLDPAMRTMLAHLELLAKRDFAELSRLCGVDREDIAEMVREIRNLEPRPGSRFDRSPMQSVVPDVLVKALPDGSWSVELNSETLPRLLVSREYHANIARRCRNEEDKVFVADCLQNANWLVRSLDQRAQTIMKVSSEIVRQQDMFLACGVEYLRPLNLKTVAEAIAMHESTVSRVTSNKYMMTPRGLFELKYFFTQAIASSTGAEAHSAEAVRHRIRQMVENENAHTVLSDDTIVDVLKKSGIDIARRTVAKYRESMNIPSSVQRRREKAGMTSRESA